VTGGICLFQWLVNVVLCLLVLVIVHRLGRTLEDSELWNPSMTHGTVAYVLLLRFLPKHPWLWYVPAALFAWGVAQALQKTKMHGSVRLILGAIGSVLWFEVAFWKVLGIVMYFCAGCIFP